MIATTTTSIPIETSNNSIQFNPTSALVKTTEFMSDYYSFEKEIELIKKQLLSSELELSTNITENSNYLVIIQDIVDSLPKLPDIKQQRLTIPEFDEIEVMKHDSAEVKKFIRKVNYEFLGYHCNHKVIDHDCDMIYKNTTDLIECKEFKEYNEFLTNMSHCVWNIRNRDQYKKVWKEVYLLPTGSEVKKLIDNLIALSGKISAYNAKMNPTCSKCNAALRKYNYSVKEIQRMREEFDEQKEIDINYSDKPAETKYDMKTFLNENYPTIDEFPLSDVKDKYKKKFGIAKTFAVLSKEIEDTKLFKVSNIHRTYFVKRL